MMRGRAQSTVISKIRSWRLARAFGCYISNSAVIGERVWFPHPTGVVIGEGVVVEDDCVIYQNVTIGRSTSGNPVYPRIGRGSVIYAGAVIVGATVLPAGTVVGANAVVIDFQGEIEGSVLVGAPARVVSRQTHSEQG